MIFFLVIHLELLFLFRSTESVFCHYKVLSAQDPKPQWQGKGPPFVPVEGLEPSWRGAMKSFGLQKPLGSEHRK